MPIIVFLTLYVQCIFGYAVDKQQEGTHIEGAADEKGDARILTPTEVEPDEEKVSKQKEEGLGEKKTEQDNEKEVGEMKDKDGDSKSKGFR